MTLIPYDPDRLDQLAMRFLDLAATFRGMSTRSRSEEMAGIELHDKKASEWLSKLEFWAADANQKFELSVIHHRGTKRAKSVGE